MKEASIYIKFIRIAGLVSICLIACFDSLAQCSGRYYDKVFPEPDVFDNILGVQFPSLTKLPQFEVNYGNADGNPLNMYIFQPDGDTVSKRPLVILAFGGSFVQGTKYSPDIIRLCAEFTARGYVTASIDYRLYSGAVDSTGLLLAMFKAVQDARAAVRFFYKDAATANTYRIDTNHIYMGGTSAGAFIGVHLGYIPDASNAPFWLNTLLQPIGGLEGNSGNPGYSSKIRGIINLAGAIIDTSLIEPGEVEMVSMHGDMDGTVPYCSNVLQVSGSNIFGIHGSGTMKVRTAHVGIYNPLYTWRGAGHVPYVDPTPTSSGPAYMDTTIWFIRDFLFKEMTGNSCGQDLAAIGRPALICGQVVNDPVDSCFTQDIAIDQGWNIISSYIDPEHPNFLDVISDISNDVLLIKNGAGQAVIPSFGINGIGNWNSLEGYQVKAAANAILTIGCEQINPSATSINLSSGWSIIPYLRTSNMDITAALASVNNEILIVKDQAGNSYIPFLSINGIGDMKPGKGYKIKMSTSGTLAYPDN